MNKAKLFPEVAAFVAATQSGTATVSAAQLAANRANAQLSSGPKSEAGRAVSSQNRTTHGLARHNGAFRLLTSEDPADFAALREGLETEHLPATETESILVSTMAESHWLANRALNLQSTVSDPATGQITDPKLAALYLRYYTTHQRAFAKALADLTKLRKERRVAKNGFEAQTAQTPIDPAEAARRKEHAEAIAVFNTGEFARDCIEVARCFAKSPEEKAAVKAKFDQKWGQHTARLNQFTA